jgi:hypothetical protein
MGRHPFPIAPSLSTWPSEIRYRLARKREHGTDFDTAWAAVLLACPAPEGWPVQHAKQVFRAAYYGHALGACLVPPEPEGTARPRTPLRSREGEWCRSGDSPRCQREPLPGGVFCEHHQAELDGIRSRMASEKRSYNNRKLEVDDEAA